MRVVVASLSLLAVTCTASSDDCARVAAAVEKLGDAPSKMVLYSLDSSEIHREAPLGELFHGHAILGQTEITDRSEQRALLRALAQSVCGGYVNPCMKCKSRPPRHALHVEQNGRSIDLVVWFEARRVDAYGFPETQFFNVGLSAQSTFDASARRYHLPRALEHSDPGG